MTNSKPWYLSRTIWASLITIVTAAAGILGLPVAGLDNAALTSALLETGAEVWHGELPASAHTRTPFQV